MGEINKHRPAHSACKTSFYTIPMGCGYLPGGCERRFVALDIVLEPHEPCANDARADSGIATRGVEPT